MLRRSVGVTKISRQMGIFDVLRKMSAVGCPSVHVSDGTSFTNWQRVCKQGRRTDASELSLEEVEVRLLQKK